jgi:tRNA pseudouridine55 synthase
MKLVWKMVFLMALSSNFLKSTFSYQRSFPSRLTSKFCLHSDAKDGDTVIVPSGLLAIFKPKDWTSSDVVSKVKGILSKGMQARCNNKRFKIKVGHGGTLDPLAEGVLVLGIGEGTKLMGDFLSGSKGYHAVALLGAETDTLDCTGAITETVDSSAITESDLNAALAPFRGDILQVPPMYSALKRDGKKLYELARDGITVEREPRAVTVHSLDMLSEYQEFPLGTEKRKVQLPHFGLDISSGGGFYVRSLISDLARSCGGRAHMTDLMRTKQGPFVLSDCLVEADWNFDKICEGLRTANAKVGLSLKPAAEGMTERPPPSS